MSQQSDKDPTVPPRTHRHPPRNRQESVVVVNTGHGKGKSTAAFGVMIRGVARDWQVAVVQYVKSGRWKVGEEKVGLQLGVDWHKSGDGFTWIVDDLERSKACAREGWELTQQLISAGEHQLVILDEITYPMNWGWISTDDVVAAVRDRPEHVNIVLTGRDAPEALTEVADTVTEMRKVSHAYDRGIRAKPGVDF